MIALSLLGKGLNVFPALQSRWNGFGNLLGKRFYSSLWIPPDGHDTGIMIHNTASKCKVPLKTLKPGQLNWYMCGPTVYDSAHIGHAVCYIRFDIIRRILVSYFNLNVIQVMGVTDIDDKIIYRAQELDVDYRVLAKTFEQEFLSDMASLRVLKPAFTPRVTEHMDQILVYIQKIIDNGYAYVVEDGSVYFNLKAYKRAGKLYKVPLIKGDKPVPGSLKKNPQDFALWKASKPNEPSWPTPWGKNGRPGWHIECSVMASRIFGKTLDLHSGGVDLLFPHHENEESQCCAHDNTLQWCNYWIHSGHLFFKDRKMSKSLHNTISIKNYLKNNSVNSFRIFCLEKAYISDIEYDFENSLNKANLHLNIIKSFFHRVDAYLNGTLNCNNIDEEKLLAKLSETRINIDTHFRDNFNYTMALKEILELIELCNIQLHGSAKVATASTVSDQVIQNILNYVHHTLSVLGLDFPSKKDVSDNPKKFYPLLLEVVPHLLLFYRDIIDYYDRVDSNRGSEVITGLNTSFELGILKSSIKDFEDSLFLIGYDIKKFEDSNISPSHFIQILNLLITFRTNVRQFALLQSHKEIYANFSKSEKRLLKLERSRLLSSSDTLRESLTNIGFLIMDHMTSTTWSISKEI